MWSFVVGVLYRQVQMVAVVSRGEDESPIIYYSHTLQLPKAKNTTNGYIHAKYGSIYEKIKLQNCLKIAPTQNFVEL